MGAVIRFLIGVAVVALFIGYYIAEWVKEVRHGIHLRRKR